jgi:hypothetical protein
MTLHAAPASSSPANFSGVTAHLLQRFSGFQGLIIIAMCNSQLLLLHRSTVSLLAGRDGWPCPPTRPNGQP